MNITVEQTLEMPNAVLFARKLEAALKEEYIKRQHFYEVIDENKKMEFINGEIYFQSPVKLWHNNAVANLLQLLKAYVTREGIGFVGFEKILISLTRNDYEPDICFFGLEKSNLFKKRQMQFPAPDFVVEVLSESTERHDRETKFQDYSAHGIGEYWIVDPEKETIEQYILEDEDYSLAMKSNDGFIESQVVEGFRISIKAVFNEKLNLAALREMLAKS
jgi:Uma2 family endonuclease